MTYEERERQLCNNCEAKENCSYISRNLERKCSFQETTMYGWELGYRDAIEKACEWLKRHVEGEKYKTPDEESYRHGLPCDYFETDMFIDDFRKAIEEQQ